MNEPVVGRLPRLATSIAGWSLLLAGDLWTLWRGYVGVSSYRVWRQNRLFDPIGAGLHLANARANALAAIVGLLVAAAGLLLLFRASRTAELSDESRPA